MYRIYISGPMSGIEDHNFPAFHSMANALRDAGYDVINPAELHDGETHHPHCTYMRTDLALVTSVDIMVCLEGWGNSSGASAEVHVAMMCGIMLVNEEDVVEVLLNEKEDRSVFKLLL